MTGKTHQLLGMGAGLAYYASVSQSIYNPSTMGAVLVFSSLGALIPDADQPFAKIWDDLPLGKLIGKLTDPLLKHRNITHSLLGISVIGSSFYFFLHTFPSYWGINSQVVFIAFMMSYLSHLFADMFTVEGIPLLFPWKYAFGIPPKPFEGIRIQTGKWFENVIIFPIINITIILIIIINWQKFHAILFK